MGVFVDAITKMKDSMFEHLKDADEGVYDTVKFDIPVKDLVRLEQDAIKFERENERLREALELTLDIPTDVSAKVFQRLALEYCSHALKSEERL